MRMPRGSCPKSKSSASPWCTTILSCLRPAARSRSSSITSIFSTLESKSLVSAPSPGPISTMKSSFAGSTASRIFARTPRSCRKCWPNRLRGRCELNGELYRLDQAAGIGLAGACEVERGAVVDRGAHERKAEGHVDAAAEARVLEHRQSLVVVHGEHGVRLLQALGNEKRIG